MIRIFFLVSSLLLSSSAFASFYDECEFEVDVVAATNLYKLNTSVENGKPTAVVAVKSAIDLGGHTDCQGYIGRHFVFEIENFSVLQPNQTVRLKYLHMNGRAPTPQGFWQSTSIELMTDSSLTN